MGSPLASVSWFFSAVAQTALPAARKLYVLSREKAAQTASNILQHGTLFAPEEEKKPDLSEYTVIDKTESSVLFLLEEGESALFHYLTTEMTRTGPYYHSDYKGPEIPKIFAQDAFRIGGTRKVLINGKEYPPIKTQEDLAKFAEAVIAIGGQAVLEIFNQRPQLDLMDRVKNNFEETFSIKNPSFKKDIISPVFKNQLIKEANIDLQKEEEGVLVRATYSGEIDLVWHQLSDSCIELNERLSFTAEGKYYLDGRITFSLNFSGRLSITFPPLK